LVLQVRRGLLWQVVAKQRKRREKKHLQNKYSCLISSPLLSLCMELILWAVAVNNFTDLTLSRM
jgi:hypothetical protein